VQLISDRHINKHLFLFPAKPRTGDTRGVPSFHGNCFERLQNVPVTNHQSTNNWDYRPQLII